MSYMYDIDFKYIVDSDHKYAYRVDKHYHDCCELVYYEKGHGYTIIDGKKYKFEPNTFSFMLPNIIHSEEGMIDNVRLLFIGFEIKNDSHLLKSGLFYDSNPRSCLLKNLKRILKENETKPFNYKEMINLLISEIVIDCLRAQNNGYNNNNIDSFDYIETFIKYNCMRRINGKTIAKQIGYSYDYFRKMFKDHFGVSIKTYLLDAKMEHALSMIKTKKYSINEIAEMTGFSSSSHFISLFKQKFGTTPMDYMENYNLKDIKKDKANYDTYYKFEEK